MPCIDRLPAIPLLASDPYLSIWMPADTMTQTDACHWSGPATVSYTHLTLPTIYSVEISGGAVSLKKKKKT